MFGFRDDFSPTIFGFGFGFGFSPVDIQWISEKNHLELKLMFYNMLIITRLLRLLNLLKIDSKYLLFVASVTFLHLTALHGSYICGK
jgi:hypothetical protein